MKKQYIQPQVKETKVVLQQMIADSPNLHNGGTGSPQLSKDEIDLIDAMDLEGAMDILDEFDW